MDANFENENFMLIKIESKEDIDIDDVQLNIILSKSIISLFGELDGVGVSPKILKYDQDKKLFIIQINDSYIEKFIQSITLTDGTTFMKQKIALRILNISKFLSNLDVNSRNDFDIYY